MPGLPWEEARAETSISGAEVPKPTMTMPISSADMPKWRASEAAPSTKRSADHRSRARPVTTASVALIIEPRALDRFQMLQQDRRRLFPETNRRGRRNGRLRETHRQNVT